MTQCGKWYSSDCLADEDIRYDESVSNYLEDQSDLWKRGSGFFKVIVQAYDPSGLPAQPSLFNLTTQTGFPYPSFPTTWFQNQTVSGSRYYQHRYVMYPPAPAEFCQQAVPADSLNVFFGGVCGETGLATYGDLWGTSTYEKDGSAIIFPPSIAGQANLSLTPLSRSFVVDDENTLLTSTKISGDDFGLFVSETQVCLDESCNQKTSTLSNFIESAGLFFPQARFATIATRIDTEEEFLAQIKETYEDFNVPEEFQSPAPMTKACLHAHTADDGTCLTEDEWCTLDPECSVSPYQEPSATVKAGPIAGIVVAFFVLLIAGLYYLHLRTIARRDERNRQEFARRIAETIKLQGSTRQLTPEGLAEEFKKIAMNGGDKIQKDELWQFMKSGKAGVMNDSEFNALFVSLDTDKSGTVDFLEFCSFMGNCHEEFEAVKSRPSVLARRDSRMIPAGSVESAAQSIARQYSKSIRNLAVIPDDEEEQAVEEAKSPST